MARPPRPPRRPGTPDPAAKRAASFAAAELVRDREAELMRQQWAADAVARVRDLAADGPLELDAVVSAVEAARADPPPVR